MTRRKTRHKRDTTVVRSWANVYLRKVAITTSVDVDKCVKHLKVCWHSVNRKEEATRMPNWLSSIGRSEEQLGSTIVPSEKRVLSDEILRPAHKKWACVHSQCYMEQSSSAANDGHCYAKGKHLVPPGKQKAKRQNDCLTSTMTPIDSVSFTLFRKWTNPMTEPSQFSKVKVARPY